MTAPIRTALDARADDIDLMSMPERLDYLRAAGEAASVLGHTAGRQWRIIEGVLEFFDAHGFAAPGSWASCVNAGVLEGIGRGAVLAVDEHADDQGNPGSRMWAAYVRGCGGGEFATFTARARAWSEARLVGMDHGVALAALRDRVPSPVEARFLAIARFYNWAMANRPIIDGLIVFAGFLDRNLVGLDPAVVGRIFAVEDPGAADTALEIALAAAAFDPQPELVAAARVVLAPLVGQLVGSGR